MDKHTPIEELLKQHPVVVAELQRDPYFMQHSARFFTEYRTYILKVILEFSTDSVKRTCVDWPVTLIYNGFHNYYAIHVQGEVFFRDYDVPDTETFLLDMISGNMETHFKTQHTDVDGKRWLPREKPSRPKF